MGFWWWVGGGRWRFGLNFVGRLKLSNAHADADAPLNKDDLFH